MADGRKKYQSDLKEYKVSFKLSEADYRKLEQDAKQSGVDRSKYLRALVQGAGEIDKDFPVDRATLIRQIRENGEIYYLTPLGEYMYFELKLYLHRHQLIYTLEKVHLKLKEMKKEIEKRETENKSTDELKKLYRELCVVFYEYYDAFSDELE